MLTMAPAPDIGLLVIHGSVISAGIFGIIAAPFISRLLPPFSPDDRGRLIGAACVRVFPVVQPNPSLRGSACDDPPSLSRAMAGLESAEALFA